MPLRQIVSLSITMHTGILLTLVKVNPECEVHSSTLGWIQAKKYDRSIAFWSRAGEHVFKLPDEPSKQCAIQGGPSAHNQFQEIQKAWCMSAISTLSLPRSQDKQNRNKNVHELATCEMPREILTIDLVCISQEWDSSTKLQGRRKTT